MNDNSIDGVLGTRTMGGRIVVVGDEGCIGPSLKIKKHQLRLNFERTEMKVIKDILMACCAVKHVS